MKPSPLEDAPLDVSDTTPHPLDDDTRLSALLSRHCVLRHTALAPELRLHQASMIEALWLEAEAICGRKLEPPYWAVVWPGGLAVARYLLDNPAVVSGHRVLDVATGNGVIALAAAMAGGRVTANDIDPVAIRLVRLHAAAHGLELHVHRGDLLETDPATLPFDVITVGDAFYEDPLASRLEPWLHAALRAGREVLVGDPGRNFLPGRGLRPIAEYEVETSIDVEGRARRTARVFRLEPASPPHL